MSQATEDKKVLVKDLVKLMNDYPIIGTVDMENMPTPQLQKMRAQLRGTVVIKMTKKRLILRALEEADKTKNGINELKKNLKGMPALLFTRDNPFKLFKTLQKNKSTAPAKAGQTAPNDIKVAACSTPFAPGPIIGELGALGIKAGIENGKVAIKEDKIVAKEGETISAELAAILSRLKIEPMEIGLDLTATYEDGTIFTKEVLNVDEDEFIQKIEDCARYAFNLAMETGFPTTVTTERMVAKAFNEAKGLALEADIITDITAVDVLAKAERQASSLNLQLDIKPVESPKEEPKQEESKPEKVEESKEEDNPVEKQEEPKVEEKQEDLKQEVKAEEPKETPKEEPKEEAPKEETPEKESKEKPKPAETPKEEKQKESPKEEKKEENQDTKGGQ